MPQEHLEIERKFDLPTPFSLPDLGTVAGVASIDGPEERSLEATYYDTADLRLLRAPITLRRRTGGPDAGWHVKLPAGEGARRELHFPLGRATRTPPRAVLAPVRGLVRTAAVGPVATLRTLREVMLLRDADGRVLAELADDTVTGTALSAAAGEPATVTSWRELEVELVDGDEDLLHAVADRLVAAGARPSDSPSKVGRVLADRLVAADGRRPGAPADGGKPRKKGKRSTKQGPTAREVVLGAVEAQVRALQEADLMVRTDHPDGVHDLRVACRRLRSILAAFRPLVRREVTDPLRDELKWLGLQLSGARDGQVALDHLRRLVESQPPELVLGPVAARLQHAEIADAATGRQDAERVLADERYFRLLDDLFAVLDEPPVTELASAPAVQVLVAAIRRSGRRLRRAMTEAESGSAGDHLHEVRKAAKRMRYTAEVAVPVLGKPAQALVERMTEVQDVLGHRQDTVVTREHCRTLGLAAFAAGENAWTYGRLHGLEEARADRAEAAFWALRPSLRKAVRRATKAG